MEGGGKGLVGTCFLVVRARIRIRVNIRGQGQVMCCASGKRTTSLTERARRAVA